ncbi:hypothetical protein PM082_011064 [Marasmius tenuissimus]|nr:hypothetical protein PM082_011064 [Marasmius tenuissimus]
MVHDGADHACYFFKVLFDGLHFMEMPRKAIPFPFKHASLLDKIRRTNSTIEMSRLTIFRVAFNFRRLDVLSPLRILPHRWLASSTIAYEHKFWRFDTSLPPPGRPSPLDVLFSPSSFTKSAAALALEIPSSH